MVIPCISGLLRLLYVFCGQSDGQDSTKDRQLILLSFTCTVLSVRLYIPVLLA